MSLDSAIAGCTRLQALQKLVTQIISIATRAVPDNKGVHLRFINRSDGYNNLNTDDLPKVRFSAGGYTPLGTSLRGNVLKPFLYDIIDSNKPLPHPCLSSPLQTVVQMTNPPMSFGMKLPAVASTLSTRSIQKKVSHASFANGCCMFN